MFPLEGAQKLHRGPHPGGQVLLVRQAQDDEVARKLLLAVAIEESQLNGAPSLHVADAAAEEVRTALQVPSDLVGQGLRDLEQLPLQLDGRIGVVF